MEVGIYMNIFIWRIFYVFFEKNDLTTKNLQGGELTVSRL